jgi:hypothetical protein
LDLKILKKPLMKNDFILRYNRLLKYFQTPSNEELSAS